MRGLRVGVYFSSVRRRGIGRVFERVRGGAEGQGVMGGQHARGARGEVGRVGAWVVRGDVL